MANCKACGEWFVSSERKELCISCERAVKRLGKYVVPVRHGRWVLDSSDEYSDHYHCDKCGIKLDFNNEIYTDPTPNYCPSCGAKMDREAPNER